MNWQDDAIVLTTKSFAEDYTLVTLLTKNHGLSKGLLRRTKRTPNFQNGTLVFANWKARLADHLGILTLETMDVPFARLIHFPEKILFLNAITTLCEMILAERHPYQILYESLNDFVIHLHKAHVFDFLKYVSFEFLCLKEIGFGFDFSTCGVCQKEVPIFYVSPKSGKGACKDCGFVYRDKLFSLDVDAFLNADPSLVDRQKIKEALTLTGFFLKNHVIKQLKPTSELPKVREHLLQILYKTAA
ncbi:MAG: DNA repair protein RecO [Proteobacteria bacterium]|nr:DNA repair protein RecO [Pseudomonadota bacterium]